MALPGKLCIGILEEDNPQKSYFRFKPLLAADGEEFSLYEVNDEFPEHGCLRIVPDKNESSRFKARMRRMGKYCLVDLREHPDDNDKIRPNKNYHGDDVETNAYIIYSDVVRELPDGMMVEVLNQEAPGDSARLALDMPTPGTNRVALSACNPAGALWSHAPIDDVEGGLALTRTDIIIDIESAQRFEVPGIDNGGLTLLVARPGARLYEPEPSPVQPPVLEDAPVQEHAPAVAAPSARPHEDAPKPWIHHDASILPRPVAPGLSPREHALALQTGMNPRRGRSLQEIIDDKWRHSRIDQLGHPVDAAVTGRPIVSPVDAAVNALRDAWEHTDARDCITQAMCRISGFGEAIINGTSQIESENHAARLREFEADREQLAGEVAALNQERERLRQEMSENLRKEMQEELENHNRRVSELEKVESDIKARAEDARQAAEAATYAIGQLTNEQLTKRISEYAVNCRAADILMNMRSGGVNNAAPAEAISQNDHIGLGELAARVRIHFAAAGFNLSVDEAINLLACFALDGYIMFSGPVGSGKTAYARLLAEALGLDRAGCVCQYRPGADYSAAPLGLTRVIMADDINARRGMVPDIMADIDAGRDTKVMLTAQDIMSGAPLDARILDRSFVIRLYDPGISAAWECHATRAEAPNDVVSAQALRALFPDKGRSVSPQVTRAMATLRAQLAKMGVFISRRALDSIWTYCATVAPHLSMSPLEAFDLAFAQRALPAILAGAPVEALHALPRLLSGMPRSQRLLSQPLPIEI